MFVWLMKYNPHYRDVTINEHTLQCLPDNGVPSDITTKESDGDISDETVQYAESSLNENEDIVYSQKSNTSSFMPVNEQQQQELDAINNKLNADRAVDWPKA